MDDVTRLSISLFNMLCVVLGSDIVVNVRRTVTNLRDDVGRRVAEVNNFYHTKYYSGSRAEGFRFESSDDDWMYLNRFVKVVPSEEYAALYDRNTTILIMENEMTKMGFTLLKLIETHSSDPFVRRSTKPFLNGNYVSSKLWREAHTVCSFGSLKAEFTHGPCTSSLIGKFEYDKAYCLQCDIWPIVAHNCIKRLNQCGWPSHDTILSIIKDGVLFVAIGAKQSYFEDTEWRMSFSLAEKKLIHAMNHTQFLCYGLLKIFLKEAIDSNVQVKGLFCSYFLKTSVFWEITSSPQNWKRSSLLIKFWKCFQRLIRWVSCSYCPNFFVPENNMFEGKIEGENRDKLLQHLNTLYCEGFRCLLRCPSFLTSFQDCLESPGRILGTIYDPGNDVPLNIIHECESKIMNTNMTQKLTQYPPNNEHKNYTIFPTLPTKTTKCITNVMYDFAASTNNALERFILTTWFHKYLTIVCLRDECSARRFNFHNKLRYHHLMQMMKILKRCQTDSTGRHLYQAMLSYNAEMYNKGLKLLQHAKDAVESPCSVKIWGMEPEIYREAGGDNLPIETVMKRCFVTYVEICSKECLSELYIEVFLIAGPVCVHPLIFALFLKYLCYNKLMRRRERDQALRELSFLVHQDNGRQLTDKCRDLSWDILGICQQMTGDYYGACHSYLMALQHQNQITGMIKAACFRLGTILATYY